jgi:iron complex outermembrane recepter protein
VNTWRGANAVTNGGTFPDTTPDRPYLSNFTFRDGFLMRKRSSISVTADYKLSANDRLSFSITRSSYNTNYDIRTMIFAIDRVQPAPGGFGPTFTRGAAGMGTLTVNTEVRDRNTTTFMPTLVYRHDGPVWKAEGGAGYSHSVTMGRSGRPRAAPAIRIRATARKAATAASSRPRHRAAPASRSTSTT